MDRLLLPAIILLFFGQVSAQKLNLDSLQSALKSAHSPAHQLEVYVQIAEYYKDHPSLEGLQQIEKAISISKSEGDRYRLGFFLKAKGEIYDELNRYDNRGTINILTESFNVTVQYLQANPKDIDAQKLLAGTLNSTAYLYWKWGKLYESLYYYDSAIRHSSKIWERDSVDKKFVRLYGLQHNSKGAVLWALGEYEEALNNYLKAYKLFERIGLQNYLSLISSNIGLIYDSWGQKDEALQYFMQAVILGLDSQNSAAIGYAYSNMGRFMETSEKYDSAGYYYNLSFKKYAEEKNQGGMGLNLNRLGSLYTIRGRYNEALAVFDQALEIALDGESYYWIALTQQNIANVWLEIGQYANALEYGKKSLALSKAYGYKEIEKDNYLTLSKVYVLKGDFRNAYNQHLQYVAIKDSLFSDEKFKQITQIKERFNAEQRERENELLRKDRQLQEQSLQRSKVQQIWLSIVLVVMAAFVAYFIFSSRRIRKVNEALTQKNQEIKAQAEELSKSNEIKNLMFSVVSHDLRGPIGNLESMLRLLNNDDITDHDFRSRLPILTKNVSHVNNLTDNLLYWAKSQIGGLNVTKIKFDVAKIVNEKMSIYYKLAEEKGVVLENQIASDTWAFGDPYMVELVIRNLISNAIKFCTYGQKVTITSAVESDYITIAVKDTGQGIPPENMPRLFSNSIFTTVGTKNEKGVGIGLMICKYFVEVNGGEIWVESVYREGSTFYFTLPTSTMKRENVV